jgi:hypothetical protein
MLACRPQRSTSWLKGFISEKLLHLLVPSLVRSSYLRRLGGTQIFKLVNIALAYKATWLEAA